MWLSTLQSLGREWISICNNGCWSIDPSKLKTDLFDLITNPDKFDECDPDHILPLPSSDYYSVSEMNSTFGKAGSNALTLFHCNIKSLPKNLSPLHILYCLDSRPNIIAISETRLNENSVSNIELPHYYFFHHDSPTAASGAGLYVSKNWKSIPTPDLQLDVELVKSCWVEVDPCNGKAHVVIGCIYTHPSANINDFTRKLDELIKNLSRKKTLSLYNF